MKNNINLEILDTTLRDGAQAEGVNFSATDKVAVLGLLRGLGIDFIEMGNPFASTLDESCINGLDDTTGVVAFGSTRRKDCTAADDQNLVTLASSNAPTVSIFGKAWDLHIFDVLSTTLDENLAMISSSIHFLKQHNKFVIFDAEHFFDGYKNNPDYARSCISTAINAGADRIVLCDTNGGAFPEEVFDATANLVALHPSVIFGIHTHNDNGCAVATTIAAVRAGARHIQGTLLGIGERCGNANLTTIICNLQLKLGLQLLPDNSINTITKVCRDLCEIANLPLSSTTPFVGASAFAHKAGMHCDGVMKCENTFEHISPESVGNTRRYLLSDLAGKKMLQSKLRETFSNLLDTDFERIVETLKIKEKQGYNFEGADGSFFILAKKIIEKYDGFFELINYKVITEQPCRGNDMATAVIKIKVGQDFRLASAEGDGPVHALDKALRAALSAFYPSIQAMNLIDYKVRVIDSTDATGAMVRVLMTSTDGQKTWSTVGISTDIIQASFFALCDAIDFKLLSDKEA